MAGIGDYIHYSQANYIQYGTNKEGPSNFAQALDIFETQKTSLKQQIQKQRGMANGLELEQVLNAIYYPVEGTQPNNYTERVRQIAEASISNRFNQWVILWNQGGGVVRSGTSHLGDKSGFNFSTLSSLKRDLEAEIGKLSSASDLSKSAQGVLQKLQKTSTTINNIYKKIQRKLQLENGADQFISYDKINDGKKILVNPQTISQINASLEAIGWYGKASATGDSFEAAIAGLDDSVTSYRDNIVTDLIDKNIITGTKQSGFDGRMSISRFDSKVSPPKSFKKTQNLNVGDASKISVEGGIGETTTTYKMDVNLTFQGENYRISAKNYKLADNHITLSSKSSPLLNLLMRTSNNDFINHYLNVVSSHPNGRQRLNSTLINRAHVAAYTSIAVEALTGSSQKQGYANYLVINGRTQKKIKVIPMTTIVDKIEYYVSIQGYPKDFTIYNKKVGQELNDGNASQRISALINKIHNIKVGATLNTSTLF